MKVPVDVNVLLDIFLNRAPWVDDSREVWIANYESRIHGYVAATALTNVFYIARRHSGQRLAIECVVRSLANFTVIPVNRSILAKALAVSGVDYEDNVSIRCAVVAGMDAIVTRDPADFLASPVPVLSPRELIERLAQGT
jgi:predicted nucleic acid-binding protein